LGHRAADGLLCTSKSSLDSVHLWSSMSVMILPTHAHSGNGRSGIPEKISEVNMFTERRLELAQTRQRNVNKRSDHFASIHGCWLANINKNSKGLRNSNVPLSTVFRCKSGNRCQEHNQIKTLGYNHGNTSGYPFIVWAKFFFKKKKILKFFFKPMSKVKWRRSGKKLLFVFLLKLLLVCVYASLDQNKFPEANALILIVNH